MSAALVASLECAAPAQDAAVYLSRGDAHEKKNEHDKALADYAMAMRLNPGDPVGYEHRAKIYVDRATRLDRLAEDNDDVGVNEGIHPEAKPDWDKAIADYSAAFELRIKSEADPTAWLKKKSDYWSKETNPAITAACWRRITKLHPKDAAAWGSLGAAERAVDDRRRAIADYTEAIRLDPKNAETYKQRAYVRGQWPEGRKKEAADYTESLRLKPDENTYMQRAPVYDILGEYDKAIADYGEAIRLGEGNLAYVQRAGLYGRMQEWDKAIADYTTILKTYGPSDVLYTGPVEIYHSRAEIYYHMKDWDRVISDMDKALRADVKQGNGQASGEWYSLVIRGDAWARKGMYGKALADFRRVSAVDAKSWVVINAEAWVLATCPDAKLRDGAKAVELAGKSCLGTSWKQAGFVDTLAAAEAETGQWKEAADYETKAITAMKADKRDAIRNHSWSSTVEEDERRIEEYTARLALYKKHQPFREMKQMEWDEWVL